MDIKIKREWTKINGTKAKLKPNDVLSLEQLYFALLLPSGNDAALVLADFFGERLAVNKTEFPPKTSQYDQISIRYFVEEMNVQVERLGLKLTHFDNPHGLCNLHNFSTAHDMAIVTNRCMYMEQFRNVVKTKCYEAKTDLKTYQWQNTNKLLGCDLNEDETPVPLFKGTLGCKTGITPTAGPCFAGAFSRTGLY